MSLPLCLLLRRILLSDREDSKQTLQVQIEESAAVYQSFYVLFASTHCPHSGDQDSHVVVITYVLWHLIMPYLFCSVNVFEQTYTVKQDS